MMKQDRLLDADFEYKHTNPYHDKLSEFDEFVLRDNAAEENLGKWNKDIFHRDGELCVEIGSGYGHFMLEFCEKNPTVNFIGMDFRFKRSFYLAKRLAKHPFKNFRYLRARGERVHFMFEKGEVDKLFYFFPDPWPKKRHHKKRLFQAPFVEAAHKVLKEGGELFIKTDHDGYAEWMNEVIQSEETLKKFDVTLKTFDMYKEKPEHFLASFQTKFEKIFIAKDVPIKAFVLKAKAL